MRLLGLLVLLLLVVALLWRRRRSADAKSAAGKQADPASTSAFHAVSIRHGPHPCEAALAMEGRRFLSNAAPPIPLPGCTASKCQCRFVHFTDRRSGEDRRSPYPRTIGMDTGTYRQEQRQRTERRRNPPA